MMETLIHIMHLEDDPADAELVHAALARGGLSCRITCVRTRDEFETALRNDGTDIILADYRLTMYDGLSALRLTRERCPEVPFIFVSGTMGEEAAIEALTRGATDYVLKHDLSRLAPAVNRALREARGRRERKLAQEALQRSNDMLRAIIEAAPVAIVGLDLDGHVHSIWNPAAEKMLGWSAREVMGRPLPTVPADRREEFSGFREQIRKGLTLDGVEVRRRRRDGTPIDYSIYASPLHDVEGRISGNIAVLVEITERKRAETQLNKQLHFLQQLLDSIPIPVYYKDKDGLYLGCNAAFEAFIGLPRKHIVGKTVREVAPKERADIHWAADLELLCRPGIQTYELGGMYKDGKYHDVIFNKATFADADGCVAGTVGAMVDITERKEAEKSIRKLSQAIEQSPVSIVITDVTGRIEFVNAKFTQITGYTLAEALGQNPRILKSGETPGEEYSRLWKTIGSGGVWQGELHNRKKSGELFWEHATIAPVRDADGIITHYVAVKEDITERKKLEEQLRQAQKMEAVGQLAGGVAHDFNNLLGVIIGRAELALVKRNLDDSLRQNLQEILASGLRSAEITRQLLAFARKQTIAPKVLDLNETVEGMLKLLRRLIGEDIDLAWLPGTRLWPVKMDPSQIDQILANLCVNARDAIAGVGKVTIETENAEFDDDYCAEHRGFVTGEYVMLAVSDNGGGMDKPTMDRIFEPFFTTKGVGKGTGLGLATVYGIVKQNAGFINVYSEPGHGSTFKIYLRRHTATEHQQPEARPVTPALTGHEAILVVEDDIAHLKTAKLILETYGYQVLAASSPSEALQVARGHTGGIHLLLTDLIMPEMNGRDLANEMVSLYPDIACLFMSGYTGNVIVQHGVLDEGVHFIQKPFSKHALAAKVREVLDGLL